MLRKALLLILAVLIIGSALFGCTSQPNEPANTAQPTEQPDNEKPVKETTFPLKEPVTMSMFAFSVPGYELDKTLVMKKMEELTNVKWDITLVNDADIAEKKALSFGTGEYYDVYFKANFTESEIMDYAKDGMIIPLNDLIDNCMPNFKALMEKRDGWKYITSENGNIYSLPQVQNPGIAMPSLFINGNWLKNLNLEMPKTEEELYEVLKAFKEKDPNGNNENDEIPLFLPMGSAPFLMPYFGIPFHWDTMSTYNKEEQTINYIPTSENYKNYLAYVARLYKEGLINENYFSATWDELNALGATTDTIGMFVSWGAYLTVGTERDEEWPMVMPFHEKSFPTDSGIRYGAFSITDKCEYPEIAARWVDYFYSEEGGILAYMGVEGETYTMNADGTYTWNTEGPYGSDIMTIRDSQTIFGYVNAPCVEPELFMKGQTNPEELFLLGERLKLREYGADPYPQLSWTQEELEQKSTLVSSINPFISQYEAEVLTGQKDLESTWDEYLETLKEMGVETVNQIDQAAYQRFLSRGE